MLAILKCALDFDIPIRLDILLPHDMLSCIHDTNLFEC